MFPRNDDAYNRLLSEFQQTNDGSFAHESLCSSYLALPGLRGFWPMSALGSDGEAMDLSGLGVHLTNENTVLQLAWPVPAMHLQSGNSERLWISDQYTAFDIIGNEGYVDTDYQGLTIGLWAQRSSIGAGQALMAKYDSGSNDRAYMLFSNTDGSPTFYVSVDGTAVVSEGHSVGCAADEWHFLVGRFDPSTSVDVWRNDSYESNTTGVPATLHNSSEDFEIGSQNGGASYLDAKVSCAFLCAAYLPDHTIRRLYYRTRPAFQNRSQW